jgi:hypothetical protein
VHALERDPHHREHLLPSLVCAGLETETELEALLQWSEAERMEFVMVLFEEGTWGSQC